MPRNGTRDTPKDLMAALAARKDGVTRVRAYIPGIAEPVAAFRVHADGGLKQRMEEWRGPNHYTSGLRNLLQRHFKKVTTGEWFSSGAVLVHTPIANSVERIWGRGARQPHPKWDNVTWEEVYMPTQPSAAEATGTLTNPTAPAADSHDDEALAPADQPTLPQSQSEPGAAQHQVAVHQQLPVALTEHLPPLAQVVNPQPEQPGRAPASGSAQARNRGDTECGSAGARDSCQPSARSVDVDKGAGWGVEGGARGSQGASSASSASTVAVSAATTWSPAGAGHAPADVVASATVASEMPAESNAATGQCDSQSLSGRKRCHATLVAENP